MIKEDMKYLPVMRVQMLLNQLPSNYRVSPNRVTGNLAIFSEELTLIGQVDFLGEGENDLFSDVTPRPGVG